MILLWLLCCVHLILMAVKMRKTFLDQPQHLIGYGISISCPPCVTDLWSGPSGKCPQIKHSNVSSAEPQQPFIASDCSHFQFSQNWFGAICALQGILCTMKTDPWEKWKAEEPEAGEMHILVTVIGKNIPSNDTIINNQTFYPIFAPCAVIFIHHKINWMPLSPHKAAYNSRGQHHVSGDSDISWVVKLKHFTPFAIFLLISDLDSLVYLLN